MTLQERLGELQALALAYPGETPIVASWRDMNRSPVVGLIVESAEGLQIVVEAQ